MRQHSFHLAALTAGAALMLAAQAHAAVTIAVGTANGAAGSTVAVSATLSTGGAMVAGTQNDFAFDASTPVVAKANGKPDCTAKVKLDGSQFAFQPAGCTGTACTAVRAIIISFSDLSPIADGAELYDCNVAIAAAATGSNALTCSGAGASDPDGNALDTTCTNGAVVVGGSPGPTNTPTPPVGTPAAVIEIGSAAGDAGQTVTFDVTLRLPLLGTEVAGTQNDITFSTGTSDIRIPAKANGKPDCDAKVKLDGSQFAFQPAGCSGDACTGVRAIIISFSDLSPIPGDTVLYTCNVQIAESAEMGEEYPLTCSGAGASDPDGNSIDTGCTNGTITVGGGGGGTMTPTGSPTPTGPTATPTKGTPGVGTPTRTGGTGGTPTQPPFVFEENDDVCAIVPPANTHSGWVLLLPAGVLLWLRRRSR